MAIQYFTKVFYCSYASLVIATTIMILALNMSNKLRSICFQGFAASLSDRSICVKQYKAAPTAHTSTAAVNQLLGLGIS